MLNLAFLATFANLACLKLVFGFVDPYGFVDAFCVCVCSDL